MQDGLYDGYTGWESEPTQIRSAILRNGGADLVIEFDFNRYVYIANLRRISNHKYSGRYIRQKGNEKSEGEASGTLFTTDDDLLLLGRWREDNSNFYWWVELQLTE